MDVIKRLYNEFVGSSGISTDTRTLKEGEMFFALSGENFNGNEFAQKAINLGASCVVTDGEFSGHNAIRVQNCLTALQELAAFHRDKLNIPIIGITGSNGKTTTKELVFQILDTKFRTVATKGNLNNHIGVPLSILSISNQTEIAVIEMGANHIGEISFLCSMTRPTHGLITNIGKAHLEGFGSFEGVKQAKSELYESLKSSNGVAFVNMSAEYLKDLSKSIQRKVTYEIGTNFSNLNADYNFRNESSTSGISLTSLTAEGSEYLIESSLYGAYNVPNIATAVTLGSYFGITERDIATAINTYEPANNRSQIVQSEGKTILLDAYNANPVSMELAIADFAERNESKSLILGGMNELGKYALQEHKKLLEFVAQYQWTEVILIGKHFADLYREFDFLWFKDVKDCQRFLEGQKLSCESLLLKGSRSFQLELLLDYIK